jgi:hypothetical protein
MLGDWASISGQDSERLKRRVKRHLGAFQKVVATTPLELRAIQAIAKALTAMGHGDLIRLLPEGGAVIVYQSSADWSVDMMRRAIETVDMMAAEEGHTLTDRGTWRDAS